MYVYRRPGVALVVLWMLLLVLSAAVTPRAGVVIIEIILIGTGLSLGFAIYGVGYWMGGWKGEKDWFVCSHCLTPQRANVPDGHAQVCPACNESSSVSYLDRQTLVEMVPPQDRGWFSCRTWPHAILFSAILLGLTGLVLLHFLAPSNAEKAVIAFGSECGLCLGLRSWMFGPTEIPPVPLTILFGYGRYLPIAVAIGLILLTVSTYWYAGLLRSRKGMLLPLVVAVVNTAVNVVFNAMILKRA